MRIPLCKKRNEKIQKYFYINFNVNPSPKNRHYPQNVFTKDKEHVHTNFFGLKNSLSAQSTETDKSV